MGMKSRSTGRTESAGTGNRRRGTWVACPSCGKPSRTYVRSGEVEIHCKECDEDFEVVVRSLGGRAAESVSTEMAAIAREGPRPFVRGEMVFYPDRVELCGVKIVSDAGVGHSKKMLAILSEKRPDGRFVRMSGEKLAAQVDRYIGIDTITGCAKSIRTSIRKRLLRDLDLICGQHDVLTAMREQISATEQRETSVQHLLQLAAPAYRLAVHILDSPDAADDVIQQSYLEALGRLRPGSDEKSKRTWFLTLVANRAKDYGRRERSRKKREATVDTSRRSSAAGDAMITALRGALSALDIEYRLPLLLCYQEDMSQNEVAAVLQMPQTTVSKRVRTGLAKLRKALERAGYPAAVAAVLGGLRQTAPAVPASLAARVEALVAQGAATEAGAATAVVASTAAAKGGLAMKLIAGVVLAGAVAAVTGGKGGATLPAGVPQKFATPCTDPSARWGKPDIWAGFPKNRGYLDGPRQGAMSFTGMGPPGIFEDGGMFVYRKYDEGTERFFTCAGSAYGDLDGPFSRARFGGWGYVNGSSSRSEDGKHLYFTNPNAGTIKRMDFDKRTVTSVAGGKDFGASAVVVAAPDGVLYVLTKTVLRVTADDKVETIASGSFPSPGGAGTRWGAYDSKNNRIYAGTRSSDGKDYPIFYYIDLAAGGKVVGLIDNRKYNGALRKQCTTGPFEGTLLHCPGSGFHGPEDPEFRFFYVAGGDEGSFYRFDVEKKYFSKFCPVEKNKVDLSHFGDYEGKVNEYRKVGGNARGGRLWSNAGVADVFITARGCALRMPRVK